MNYVIRAFASPFHPPPTQYTDLADAKRAALRYSQQPLDIDNTTYGVFEVESGRCVAAAVDGVVYVREDERGMRE